MFENLLHREAVAERLRKEIGQRTLPPALLYWGPAYGGKLTAALETARCLSCREDGVWNCDCGPCSRHRALMNPHTLLLGSRNMEPEIAASIEVVSRTPESNSARYLLVRAVQKLLRRFDFVLWEGGERKLNKDALTALEILPESTEIMLPGGNFPSGKKMDTFLKNLKVHCESLQKCLPGLLPIAQTRRISSWAHQTLENDHKTVIIDAADRMLLPSENSLLKFLEEPPPNTTVILLSDRKAVLLPTTLSRIREYTFRRRTVQQEQTVIKRVFKEENIEGGLQEFFLTCGKGAGGFISELARLFLDKLASGQPFPVNELSRLTNQADFDIFLTSLTDGIRTNRQLENNLAHARYHLEASNLRKARIQVQSLNLPIHHVLRNLFLSMEVKS